MPPLYCKPSENVAPNATWAVTAGAANALYPVDNVKNLDPSNPTKSTGTSYTIRATFGAAQVIKVAQFVMHNLGGRTITITNNSGLNTTLIPAADYADGFPEFAWKDLRGLSNSATQWTFAITVAAGIVHLGELVLWQEARFLPLLWELEHGPRRLAHKNVTDWGYEHYYDRGIRERVVSAKLIDGDYRNALLELEADAHGCVKQFPMILEDTTQESYWVRFAKDEFFVGRDAPNISPMTFQVQETGLGLAP